MESFFEFDYAIRALTASVLVGMMCGILGCFIFLRNMALVGDALSHAILPGVVLGFLIAGTNVVAFFLGSVAAGLVAAILITFIQTRVKSKEDAAIGVVFSTMFSLGVIGISLLTKKEGVHLDLKDFLFGNILAITTADLLLTFTVATFVLAATVFLYRFLFITTFDPTLAKAMGISTSVIHYFLMLLLSFTVVACLQSVGVILVVGMLIIPASIAYTLAKRLPTMLLYSALIGIACTVSGFFLAFQFDIAPGPAMNIVGAFLYVLAILFSPESGKISGYLARRKANLSMKVDDFLKAVVAQGNQKEPDVLAIQQRMGWSNSQMKSIEDAAVEMGWVQEYSGKLELTGAGVQRAFELVGAHRTWEQFMVESLGYDKSQVHPQAEQLEHFLTPQLVDEIQAEMGRPLKDPHGAYIPQAFSEKECLLSMLNEGEKALILTRQANEHVMALLWKEGLSPNHSLTMKEKSKDGFTILVKGKEKNIPLDLAQTMQVVKIER